MDSADFSIVLEDLVTPGARKAKASIASLTNELQGAKSKLAGAQGQLSLAKELGDVEGFRKYSKLVTEGRRNVFDLTQKLEAGQDELKDGSESAAAMATALGAVATGAAIAATAILTVASATKSLIVYTLEASNSIQRQTAMFDALGLAGKDSGKKTIAMLDEVGSKLPQSEDQLVAWTKGIQAMGVTDLKEVRKELVATASAQALMGDEGAAAYTKLQEKVRLAVEAHHGLKMPEKALKSLYAVGLNVSDVAKRMGMSTEKLTADLKAGTIDAKKFGAALTGLVTEKGKTSLDVMMNSLGAMWNKLDKAVGDLFEDADTKPLTDALRNVIGLGEDGASSAEVMKIAIVGAMNAIMSLTAKAITEVSVLFLRIELAGLQAYVALKPLIGAFETLSKGASFLGSLPSKVVGGAAETVGADPEAAKQGLSAVGDAGMEGIKGLLKPLPFLFADVITTLGDAKAQELARAGGEAVGKATIAGIKQGVDAHSPSRAARKVGANVIEGMGEGMVDSPAMSRATRTVSSNALGGLSSGMLGGTPANDGGGGTTIGPIYLTIQAPEGVTDAQALTVAGVSAMFERLQLATGR